MKFRFSMEDEEFRAELRDFLKKEIPSEWYAPQASWEAAAELARIIRKKLGGKGWRTMAWPREYGGENASFVRQAIYKEELFYHDVERMDDQGVGFVGPCIMLHGTEEQKEFFLPRIASGDIWWCQGFSEPDAGSDLASLQTRAVPSEDHYVINGRKIWTTYAHIADWMHILARTDPAAPKHKGISYFLLNMRTPGISIRPIYNMSGEQRNFLDRFHEVTFDNVKVPKSNLLGEPNRGWYAAMTSLDFERSGIEFPAQDKRILEMLVEWLRSAREEKRRYSVRKHIERNLAERAVEIEIGRFLCYRIAWMQDQGLIPNAEASSTKLFVTETHQRLANTSMQILGLSGQLVSSYQRSPFDGFFGDLYRSAVSVTIAGGTSEIQRNILATRGLGLPKGN